MKESSESPICFTCKQPITKLEASGSGSVLAGLASYIYCEKHGMAYVPHASSFICPVCFSSLFVFFCKNFGIVFCSNPQCSSYSVEEKTENCTPKYYITYLDTRLFTFFLNTKELVITYNIKLNDRKQELSLLKEFLFQIFSAKNISIS